MNDKERESLKMVTDMHHDLLVVMQPTLIEWKHGKGAEAALQWIVNTLTGPGHLPDLDEARARGGAQAWFDQETVKDEEFRASRLRILGLPILGPNV